MSAAFYDFVRGRSDDVPAGYTATGLRVYRHLVYLGASQMIEAHFPAVREQLGDDAWRTLIEAFIRQSEWTSPYYGDLKDDFLAYLARESA
ncbi:DNA-binding domain-containing protein [Aquabacterium sp.]|uniref:HvfC/BufC N-terminal domain-containing protein n=1 Tax=Aquabacterium sp. TaxID=1872578 RepID=UPI002631F235|nr:DNA-binding domain-containing protein [Aquabacterium sp.]MDD2976548.1 DNA-binding domain-containing protein [Aquabacterium sp.]